MNNVVEINGEKAVIAFDPEIQMLRGEFVGLKQVMSLVILELWHMIFVDRELRFP